MNRRASLIVMLIVVVVAIVAAMHAHPPDASADRPAAQPPPQPPTTPARPEFIRALLERSRLLDDVNVQVPRSVYERFLRDALGPQNAPPVDHIVQAADYRIHIDADRRATLHATLRVRTFDPMQRHRMLSRKLTWTDVRIDGRELPPLPATQGWLMATFDQAGMHTLSAVADLGMIRQDGQSWPLPIQKAVRTHLRVTSPQTWQVTAETQTSTAPQTSADQTAVRRLTGTSAGTDVSLDLPSHPLLQVDVRRPPPAFKRTPRLLLSGNMAWHFDMGLSQLDADVEVRIVGGATDRLSLQLPSPVERATVTGPDVRQARINGHHATVFLKGDITGRTQLRVAAEWPAKLSGTHRISPLSINGGRWTDGTFVITASGGDAEVLPAGMVGLQPLAAADIPESARALLRGPPAAAYRITGGSISAEVEILRLGEFALQETLADLAHYEVVYRGDGASIVRAAYEIRNRSRQFITLTLPADATILLASVNEKATPLTALPGQTTASSALAFKTYLLPLVRSQPTVEGLVSFPLEIVYISRAQPLQTGRGQLDLPLPRVDIPIAYGWAQVYLPHDLEADHFNGPMKFVTRFTSDKAGPSLTYGHGEYADGYKGMTRPNEPLPAKPARKSEGLEPLFGTGNNRFLSPDKLIARPQDAKVETILSTAPQPLDPAALREQTARNYYRTGRDAYQRGDIDRAREYLRKAAELGGQSPYGLNARKLLSNTELVGQREESSGVLIGRKDGYLTTTITSQSGKAAAVVVEKQLEERNRLLLGGQRLQLQKGFEHARKGDISRSQTFFRQAEQAGKELQKRGVSVVDQDATLRESRDLIYLNNADLQSRAEQLKAEAEELQQAGQYDQARKKLTQARQQARQVIVLDEKTEEKKQQDIDAIQQQLLDVSTLAARSSIVQRSARINAPADTPEPSASGLGNRPILDIPDPAVGTTGTALPPINPVERTSLNDHETLKTGIDLRYAEIPWYDKIKAPKDWEALQRERGQYAAGAVTESPDNRHVRTLLARYDIRGLLNRKGFAVSGKDLSEAALKRNLDARRAEADRIAQAIRETANVSDVTVNDGIMTVQADAAAQRVVAELLAGWQQSYGPNVDGWVQDSDGLATDGGALQHNEQFQDFVDRNYDNNWTWKKILGRDGKTVRGIGGAIDSGDISSQVARMATYNVGLKISVAARNLAVSGQDASAAGITWVTGANDVRFAVIDEAQYLTLAELAGGQAVRPGNDLLRQDAIIGTDVRLSNDMNVNVARTGSEGNTFDLLGNAVTVGHDRMLLIDSGGYVTALRGGRMRNWSDTSEPIVFPAPPQTLTIPRVGVMYRFEKTLIQPGDDLGIRATTSLKGD